MVGAEQRQTQYALFEILSAEAARPSFKVCSLGLDLIIGHYANTATQRSLDKHTTRQPLRVGNIRA